MIQTTMSPLLAANRRNHTSPSRYHHAAMDFIGARTLGFVSAGRYIPVTETTLRLPHAHGYIVDVIYDRATDTYTVASGWLHAGRYAAATREVFGSDLADTVYDAILRLPQYDAEPEPTLEAAFSAAIGPEEGTGIAVLPPEFE